MVTIIKGDIWTTKADIRINTVNCEGVMGKGIALTFKQKYPAMFRAYKRECDQGMLSIGKLHIWKDATTGEIIVNFPTKTNWRQSSRYSYLTHGLIKLAEFLGERDVTVAMPALGCSNGGLDWEIVQGMVEEHLGDLRANVLLFSPQV